MWLIVPFECGKNESYVFYNVAERNDRDDITQLRVRKRQLTILRSMIVVHNHAHAQAEIFSSPLRQSGPTKA